MINSKKKGFTIVELVIVIAVIAILSAVLIPTFSNLVKKANLNADQQTIRNMNTTLATYTDHEKEISDIMAYLRANGFSYEKMITYSKGYHYCYSKEENKMYLLDDDDNVVYPTDEIISKSSLWSAYGDHATYIINGITNYYAITTIANQTEFDSSFTSSGYVLDLNDNVCTVNGNDNVEVLNGFVTGTGFTDNNSIVRVSEANDTNTVKETLSNGDISKITYTNVKNPAGWSSGNNDGVDGMIIEYINCVFTIHAGFYQNSKSVNLVFKNCSFINIDTFGMTLQPGGVSESVLQSSVEITGCKFINCNRGINISDWENTKVSITDCTFALKTGNSAYNCIQISNYDTTSNKSDFSDESYDELATLELIFKNNTVSSANGVVYFHDEMTGAQTANSFISVVSNFSNNKYASGIDKIADRNEYKNGHLLYNNDTLMQELANLIK